MKLHLHYSALDGGLALAAAAQRAVDAASPAFDVAGEFPEAWDAFLAGTGGLQQLAIPLRRSLLPPAIRQRTVVVTQCNVHLLTDDGGRFEVALGAPFPSAVVLADPVATGAIVSTASIAIGSTPLQPVPLRVRARGATDWVSLARHRLRGMIVEFELGAS